MKRLTTVCLLFLALDAEAQNLTPKSPVSNNPVTATGSTTARTLAAWMAGLEPLYTTFVKSDTGSDSNSCLNWVTPCATVYGALSQMVSPWGDVRGTVYIVGMPGTSGQAYIGGPVAGQGIRIVGANGNSRGKTGWIYGTHINFIGIPWYTAQGMETTGQVFLVPSSSQTNWRTPVEDYPIWLDGASTITFQNIAFAATGVPVHIGYDYSQTQTHCDHLYFTNFSASVWPSGTYGPAMDAGGGAQWFYLNNTQLFANNNYTGNSQTDDQRWALVAHNAAPQIRDSTWGGGAGVRVYANTGGDWYLEAEDFIVEGSPSDAAANQSPIQVVAPTAYGSVYAYSVNTADYNVPAVLPMVQVVDASYNEYGPTGGGVLQDWFKTSEFALNSTPGAASIGTSLSPGYPAGASSGSYPFSPWRHKNLGIGYGELVGPWPGIHRAPGVYEARYQNQVATTLPTSATQGTVTATSGQRDPYGGSNATLYTASGGAANVQMASIPKASISSGDRFVFGGWLRNTVAGTTYATGFYALLDLSFGTLSLVGPTSTTGITQVTCNQAPVAFDTEWVFLVCEAQANSSVSSSGIGMWLEVQAVGDPIQVYAPFLYRVPVADPVDIEEFAQWAATIGPSQNETPAGNVGTLPGQVLYAHSGVVIDGAGATGTPAITAPRIFLSQDAGYKTLSSGSATVTVATGHLGCVCTDNNTTTATAVGCSLSGTTLTIKGTGSDSIAYMCF